MYSFDVKITSTAGIVNGYSWDGIQLTVEEDIKVNRMLDMQSQLSKKINIERKTKKNTFSLVSDLDVEKSMSKVSYQQFLSLNTF